MSDEAPVQITDDQDLEVDIEKIYKNFIIEIDKIRSHVSVQNNPSLQKITNSSFGSDILGIIVDKNPQESRCHAFYRLLGLPISNGSELYCPGMDIPNNSNKELNDAKSKIAQKVSQSKPMLALLDARENNARTYLSIFSLQDVDAMVLAMSLAEIRAFNTSLEKISGSFDTDLKNQVYTAKLSADLVHKVVNNGNKATKVFSDRLHILAPFIVDPRIDLSISPGRNRLAVPFLSDKSETKLTDNVYLKRPYIEKICRERLDIRPKINNYGDNTKSIIDNIKNNDSIKDVDLIKKAFNSDTITSDSVQFLKYFNAIRSVLNKLFEATNDVTRVLAAATGSEGHADFNWTPIPAKTGPENGCTTRDLLTGQANDPNNTNKDKDLLQQLYKQNLNSISNKLNNLEVSDLGGFAFDNIELTPDTNSSDSFKDITATTAETQTNFRNSLCDTANAGVRTIEIIMGEFSGLGLCDILAISAAFWVVDKDVLLDLLDDVTIQRILLNKNLISSEVTARASRKPDINASLLKFQNKVKEIFDVMEKLYQQIKTENAK